MIRSAAWAVLILPFAGSAAPVPTHLLPEIRVELRLKSGEHPLGSGYELTLRNIGTSEFQLWTNRPFGLDAYLEYEILDAAGHRVLLPSPLACPAPDPSRSPSLRGTIPGKGSLSVASPWPFRFIESKKLPAGKYRVRARFDYREQHAASEWLTVEVTELDLRTRNLVAGP